mmetsp:Transcript_26774/g.58215  ORF Transcript_26774/g.58215 Transcript_26774/m.58215 type:complete len:311 (+) Transcript_26774:456-1388(+)|eukprot:CAMPEP_0206487022 /NCGR_PEP_ID=MMETSP0324_2-20121206/41365_1 /ASSEMBLY_ACC=CAM_ASM_000836 /TAXON_ID=2866 /ORGANISM="Crypthecodinium cohnii, Strain Seligo" /LENGTH=310 /DNA_ID=CAMNT_0053965367 /DNA_START=389 /DNA_END=1321 /DNA_ORIENTATION=+
MSAEPDDVTGAPRPFLEVESEVAASQLAPGVAHVTPAPQEPRTRQAPRPIDTEESSPRCSEDDRKISLDLTPLSCKSTNSYVEYHQPNQTIIILDWDDTLCPSTTCMRHLGLSVLGDPPEGKVAQELDALAMEVGLLLDKASELAEKVVIVTNAEEGWIELACKAWLPSLLPHLERAEVVSARSTWEPKGVASPAGWKAKAFEDAVAQFYSRYAHQSWKNIISIGDAPHEREALSRVVRGAPIARGKRCRSKSVKFILRPSIPQLKREIQLLCSSLREIVWHDDDLDLHFATELLSDNNHNTTNSGQARK